MGLGSQVQSTEGLQHWNLQEDGEQAAVRQRFCVTVQRDFSLANKNEAED